MKKPILILLICSLLLLPLMSCSLDKKQNEVTTPDTTTDATTESTTPAPVPDETTTPDDIGLTPPEEDTVRFEDVFNSGIATFPLQLFVYDAETVLDFTSISVEVLDWRIAIDNVEYISAKIVDNPTIIYPQKITTITNKNADEVYNILAYIQNSESCCMIKAEYVGIYNKELAVYNIADVYYLVDFYENGRVKAIYHTDVNDVPKIEGELDRNSTLIVTLVDYLETYWLDISPMPMSFAAKIRAIKNGFSPLYVDFDQSNDYFVCGYYNPNHDNDEQRYCCARSYTWVKYENESDIQEYCNGMQFVVAFQINKASTVENILSMENPVPAIEHYAIYTPTFENGINTAVPQSFYQSSIFVNYSDVGTVYYNTETYYNETETIPCVYLENKPYISIPLYTIDATGKPTLEGGLSNEYFQYEFGEYYDILVGLMDTQKYSITSGDYTHCYGVISLEAFINGVVQ